MAETDKSIIEQRGNWKIHNTEVAYENPWIKVNHHQITHPGNKPGIYGEIKFKNLALGVIVLDDELNTWLVGQHRFPQNEYTWEIPEGGGEIGVNPLLSAKRELLEETGITAKKWTQIVNMHLSNSVSDEFAIVYLAQNLSFGKSMPDEDEELEVKKVPFNDFYDDVEAGVITDSLTVAAALKIKVMLLKKMI